MNESRYQRDKLVSLRVKSLTETRSLYLVQATRIEDETLNQCSDEPDISLEVAEPYIMRKIAAHPVKLGGIVVVHSIVGGEQCRVIHKYSAS